MKFKRYKLKRKYKEENLTLDDYQQAVKACAYFFRMNMEHLKTMNEEKQQAYIFTAGFYAGRKEK